MEVQQTPIPDLLVIQPRVFNDPRGYFFESYNAKNLLASLGAIEFVQDNEALSVKGVLRGLHYQVGEFAQAKLVRVVRGKILDVAVDIRPGSPTYGKWFAIELSSENKKQLFVPKGFAHGYHTLSAEAIFSYKCDNYYSKAHEGGIKWDDASLGIDWNLGDGELILSEKDRALPYFGDHVRNI